MTGSHDWQLGWLLAVSLPGPPGGGLSSPRWRPVHEAALASSQHGSWVTRRSPPDTEAKIL